MAGWLSDPAGAFARLQEHLTSAGEAFERMDRTRSESLEARQAVMRTITACCVMRDLMYEMACAMRGTDSPDAGNAERATGEAVRDADQRRLRFERARGRRDAETVIGNAARMGVPAERIPRGSVDPTMSASGTAFADAWREGFRERLEWEQAKGGQDPERAAEATARLDRERGRRDAETVIAAYREAGRNVENIEAPEPPTDVEYSAEWFAGFQGRVDEELEREAKGAEATARAEAARTALREALRPYGSEGAARRDFVRGRRDAEAAIDATRRAGFDVEKIVLPVTPPLDVEHGTEWFAGFHGRIEEELADERELDGTTAAEADRMPAGEEVAAREQETSTTPLATSPADEPVPWPVGWAPIYEDPVEGLYVMVCHLCGQPHEEGECNSGRHVGPGGGVKGEPTRSTTLVDSSAALVALRDAFTLWLGSLRTVADDLGGALAELDDNVSPGLRAVDGPLGRAIGLSTALRSMVELTHGCNDVDEDELEQAIEKLRKVAA